MKNKTRKEYVKPMRRLTLISLIVLIVCVVFAFMSQDITSTGFFSILFGLSVFIVLHVIQYRMMHTCRCRKCGHVEVFEMKRIVVVGVLRRCPKCNSKLKPTEIME